MGANSKAIVPITLEYNKTLNDFERDTKKKINELNKEFDKLEKAIDAAMPEKGFFGDFSEAKGELKQLRTELDQLKDSFDLSSINDQITELYAKIDARFKPLKKEVQNQLGDLLDGIGADTELGKLLKSVQGELGKSATAVEEFDKLKQKVDEVATSAETTKRTANRLRAEWKELDISKITQLEAVMGNVDAKTESLARSLKEVQERLEAIASQHIDQIVSDANTEDTKKSGKSSGKKVVSGTTLEIDGEIFDKLKTESSGAASAVSELKTAANEASGAVKELAANVGKVPAGQVSTGGSVSLSEDSVRQLLGVIAQPQQVVVMANPQSIQKVKADVDEAIPEKKTVEVDVKQESIKLDTDNFNSIAGWVYTYCEAIFHELMHATIDVETEDFIKACVNDVEANLSKLKTAIDGDNINDEIFGDSLKKYIYNVTGAAEELTITYDKIKDKTRDSFGVSVRSLREKSHDLFDEFKSLQQSVDVSVSIDNTSLQQTKTNIETVAPDTKVVKVVPEVDQSATQKVESEFVKLKSIAPKYAITEKNVKRILSSESINNVSNTMRKSITSILDSVRNDGDDPFGIKSIFGGLDKQIDPIKTAIGSISFESLMDGSSESAESIEKLRVLFAQFANSANESISEIDTALSKEAVEAFGKKLFANGKLENSPMRDLYEYYNEVKNGLSGSGINKLQQFVKLVDSLKADSRGGRTDDQVTKIKKQLDALGVDKLVSLKEYLDKSTSSANTFVDKLSSILGLLDAVEGKNLSNLPNNTNSSSKKKTNSLIKNGNFDANYSVGETLADNVFSGFTKAKDKAVQDISDLRKAIETLFDKGYVSNELYNSLEQQISGFTGSLESYESTAMSGSVENIQKATKEVKDAAFSFSKTILKQLQEIQTSINASASDVKNQLFGDDKDLPKEKQAYRNTRIAYNTATDKGASFAQRIVELFQKAIKKNGLSTDWDESKKEVTKEVGKRDEPKSGKGTIKYATVDGVSKDGKRVSVNADVLNAELSSLNLDNIIEAQTLLNNATNNAKNLRTDVLAVNSALNKMPAGKVQQAANAMQQAESFADETAEKIKSIGTGANTPEVKYELTPQTNLNQEVEADIQTVETQKIPYVFVQSTGAGATGGVDLSSESSDFAALATAINTNVIGAIKNKNKALEDEKGLVKTVTDAEVQNFQALGGQIQDIVDPLSKLLDALNDKKITVPDLAKILGDSKNVSPKMYETLGEGIEKIKRALMDFDPDSFERFIVDISALKLGKGTLTNIENLGGSLKKLRDEFKAIDDTGSIGDLKFFQDIDLLLSRSKDLQNLATILKNVNSSAINTLKKSDQRTANEEVTVAYKKQIAAIKEYLKVYKQYKYGLASEDDLTAAKNKKSAAKGGVTRALNKYGSDVTKDFSALRVQIDGLENSISSIDAEYTATMQHISDATGNIAKDTADWEHAMSLLNDSDMFKDAIHNGRIYYDLLENIERITRTARLDPTTGDMLVSYLMEDSSGNKLTLGANGNLLIEKANILDNTAAINQLTKAKEKLAVVEKKVISNPDDVSTKYVSLYNQLNQQLTEIVAKYGEWSSFKPKTQEEALGFQLMANAISETVGELNLLTKAEQGTSEIKRIKLLEQIATWMDKNTKAAKTFAKELAEIQADINTQGADLDYNKTLNKFLSIKTAAAAGGNLGKTFWESFANRANYTLESALTQYLSLQDVVRYAQQAVSVINDLDYALLDLKKTTAMSDAELEEFYYTSSDLAGQLGVTTQEIIELSSAWSRLG